MAASINSAQAPARMINHSFVSQAIYLRIPDSGSLLLPRKRFVAQPKRQRVVQNQALALYVTTPVK